MSVNESFSVNRGAARLAPEHSLRVSQADSRWVLANAALVGVVALSSVLAMSVAGTDVLMPETLRPVSGSPALAGLLVNVQHLRSGAVLTHGLFGLKPDHWAVMALLGALFFCYVLTVRLADRLSPRAVLAAVVGVLVMMLIAPPIISTDIFSYQAYAREFTIYGANPYLNGPYAIALDPIYHYVGAKWITTPSVYGPLFTLLSTLFAGPVHLSQEGIAASAYVYKAIAALAALATVGLIWRSAKLRGLDPVPGAVLFGLNPLVTFYGIGGGHNDLLTVLLTTAAIYAVLSKRQGSAGSLISIATAIKLTAGLVLPFALASGVGLGARSRRRSLLLGAVIAAVATAAIGFAFFGAGMLHLPLTLDQVQNEGAGQTLPGFISGVLRIGWLGHLVGLVQGALFVIACGWLLRKVYRGEMDWIDGLAWATFGVLVSTSSILPWYVSWMLPPIALCTTRRLWTVSLWFTGWVLLTTLLAYIPHGATLLGL